MTWEEGKIHQTLDGTRVRSKSEVVIYNILLNSQTSFEYERKLEVGSGKALVPDFYFDAGDGKCMLWEHFGLMAEDQYKIRAEEKLAIYKSLGFSRGVNLFVTYDDPQGGIDSSGISKLASFIAKKMGGMVDFDEPYAANVSSVNEQLADLIQELSSIEKELAAIDQEDHLQEQRRQLSKKIVQAKEKLLNRKKRFAEATEKGMTLQQYEAHLNICEAEERRKNEISKELAEKRQAERRKVFEQKHRSVSTRYLASNVDIVISGDEHEFRVFYSIKNMPTEVDCNSPILMEIADVYSELFLGLEEPGEFFGVEDDAGTTLQMVLEDNEPPYWAEVPCPEKNGRYGKALAFDEAAYLIKSLTGPVPREGFPDFAFSSY